MGGPQWSDVHTCDHIVFWRTGIQNLTMETFNAVVVSYYVYIRQIRNIHTLVIDVAI